MKFRPALTSFSFFNLPRKKEPGWLKEKINEWRRFFSRSFKLMLMWFRRCVCDEEEKVATINCHAE